MKRIFALLAVMLLLCGCGQTEEKNEAPKQVDIDALYTQLEGLGLPAMVEVNADMQLSLYGIESADTRKSKVTISDDGLRADEVWLIEAVNAEAAARIEGLVKSRIQQKDDESVTYSPEQNAIVKKSMVKVAGNYVFFICSPEVEAMQKAVDTALGN